MHKTNKKHYCFCRFIIVSTFAFSALSATSVADDRTSAERLKSLSTNDIPVATETAGSSTTLIRKAGNSDDATIDLSELTMTVYKSPACGCCRDWVDYMKAEGFTVKSVDTDDMTSVKSQLGLTSPELHSCHTAVIDGYVIEGHVPADDVKRLLTEKPDLLALTAPGMPMMSPGMASRIPQDYDVLSVDKDGDIELWSAY